MNLFESARLAHIAVGIVVLSSFWVAAFARKGSPRHRLAGRIYAASMAILLGATVVMAAGMVQAGTPMRAVFGLYVSLISVATVWMAWRSSRDRHDIDRYLGRTYKSICGALGAYGLFLLVLVPRMGEPARMAMVSAFAVLGLTIAGAMAWRISKRANHPRWWLSEHLTAMALNFAATHASFSLLAGGLFFPALKDPWLRTVILVAWMLSALAVRLWAQRRFLGAGSPLPSSIGSRAASPPGAAQPHGAA
jgi:hypothetical protein